MEGNGDVYEVPVNFAHGRYARRVYRGGDLNMEFSIEFSNNISFEPGPYTIYDL